MSFSTATRDLRGDDIFENYTTLYGENRNNHKRKALPLGLLFHPRWDSGGDAKKPECSLGRA